jgi:peroxiredoxin Q/BCP
MAIVVNKPIPEFESNATGGVRVTHTSHLGRIIVLYFYPKDNTPGCTTEAMQFRDKYHDFVKRRCHRFWCISRDNMKSHDDFKQKLELPFELIADTEEKMCHMFGVVKNKIMYGKKVKGIERSTFLIGADGLPQGRVARAEGTWSRGRRAGGRQGTQEGSQRWSDRALVYAMHLSRAGLSTQIETVTKARA